jgi:hypothetical protein
VDALGVEQPVGGIEEALAGGQALRVHASIISDRSVQKRLALFGQNCLTSTQN